MAANQLVACELLCYLANKFGKIDNKKLNSTLYDFYTPEQISVAKDILMCDAERLNPLDKWPRPTKRRESDPTARAGRDLKDILAIWTYFDEHKTNVSLPEYVVRDINLVPTGKLEDGDIRVIINKIDHLETGYQELRRLINEFGVVMRRSVKNYNISSSDRPSFKTTRSEFNMRQSTSSDAAGPAQLRDSGPCCTTDTDCEWEISPEERRRRKRLRRGLHQPDDVNRVEKQAGFSSQIAHAAMFNTAVKQNPPGQMLSIVSNQGAIQKSKLTNKPSTRIVGKGGSAKVGVDTISGVKDLTKKKVFLIGNLNRDCTEESLTSFINCLGVKVYTIYPTKTRFKDNCFRVCVDATDLTSFCDPNCWPRDVAIRDWIHKKTKNVNPGDTKDDKNNNVQPIIPPISSDVGIRSWGDETQMDTISQLASGLSSSVCN